MTRQREVREADEKRYNIKKRHLLKNCTFQKKKKGEGGERKEKEEGEGRREEGGGQTTRLQERTFREPR
jgi:hypothetical protein